MRGRKRKFSKDFVGQPWEEPNQPPPQPPVNDHGDRYRDRQVQDEGFRHVRGPPNVLDPNELRENDRRHVLVQEAMPESPHLSQSESAIHETDDEAGIEIDDVQVANQQHNPNIGDPTIEDEDDTDDDTDHEEQALHEDDNDDVDNHEDVQEHEFEYGNGNKKKKLFFFLKFVFVYICIHFFF